MKVILFYFAFILFVSLIGCSNDNGIKTNESGLQYFDESLGEGRVAKNGDLVSVNFRGWIVKDSTKLFDDWSADSTKQQYLFADSYLTGRGAKFILGDDLFIKGTDEGIEGMQPGGKRIMVIPSDLAYGKEGIGPIPPDTDLKIAIELLEVKDAITAELWDIDINKIVTTESGLKYVIVSEGEGEYAVSGNVVTVNYSGFLTDSTKFDSSVEREEPLTFVVGNNQVIAGWDEGIRLLKKGGKARLIIPASLGYGGAKVGNIPPNSTLIFDVELLDIK